MKRTTKSSHRPVIKWTDEQYEIFRNTVQTDERRLFYDLMRHGLRKNEVFALTPADILADGLAINKSYDVKLGLMPPKTPPSVAPMPTELLERLKALADERKADERIFMPFNANYYFVACADKAELPKTRITALRVK